ANLLRERRVRRLELPALEVRSMEIPIDRVEVVPHPERLEPEPVHEERVLAQRLPRGVLRPEVDSELHGQAHPVSTLSPCSAPRAALFRFSSLSARWLFCGRSSSYSAATRARAGRLPFSGLSRAI